MSNIFKETKSILANYHEIILRVILPDGVVQGGEYIAINPVRSDSSFGSFKFNLKTGKWSDFAVRGAKGSDIISYYAYINKTSQMNALKKLIKLVGC